MTDVTTPTVIDHDAKLRFKLARVEQQISETRHEIDCLQSELDDLEIERSDLLDELDEGED